MTGDDDLGTEICAIHIRRGDRSPLHLVSEDMMAHFEQVEAELIAIRTADKLAGNCHPLSQAVENKE